jgi:hypothetical protein
MFVYLYLVFSHVRAAATSIPSAVQTCQRPLHPFLTITTRACGMTTQRLYAYSNPLFFTSKYAARMLTGTEDDVRRNVELGTLLGKTVV